MSERNRFVEYPSVEALHAYGELENYLRLAIDDHMFSYDELPDIIVAKAVETYANWLAELTQRDPKHWERGATPYFDGRKGDSLVFPANPPVGDGVVLAIFPKNPLCTPSGFMHSHPDASCFSDCCDGDIEGFLDSLLPFEHVATAENNYLLLRTNETLCIETSKEYGSLDRYDSLLHEMDGDKDVQEIEKMHTEVNLYGTGLSRDLDCFYNITYLPLLINLFCAKKYKYGFYCSHKDGIYKRWGKEDVAKYLTDLMGRVLQEGSPVGDGHGIA